MVDIRKYQVLRLSEELNIPKAGCDAESYKNSTKSLKKWQLQKIIFANILLRVNVFVKLSVTFGLC